MISRTKFNQIQVNDYIVFKKGRIRRVIGVDKEHYGRRIRIRPRTFLTFKKINGSSGYTMYLWNDVKHKIIGKWHMKLN